VNAVTIRARVKGPGRGGTTDTIRGGNLGEEAVYRQLLVVEREAKSRAKAGKSASKRKTIAEATTQVGATSRVEKMGIRASWARLYGSKVVIIGCPGKQNPTCSIWEQKELNLPQVAGKDESVKKRRGGGVSVDAYKAGGGGDQRGG